MTARARVPGLRELARAWGVQTGYRDYLGRRRDASPDALLGVLRALGAPVAGPADVRGAIRERASRVAAEPIEPVHVAWDGHLPGLTVRGDRPPQRCLVRLETGEAGRLEPLRTRRGRDGVIHLDLELRLPAGYHEVVLDLGDRTATGLVIAAPRRAPAPAERSWGVFLPLHAFRGGDSDCVGDFGDMDRALRWVADLGGSFVGTLPLLPVFLDAPASPSPYAPVSRLFWNELFVDLRAEPGAAAARAGRSWRERRRRCNAGELVDYEPSAALRREALDAAARAFFERGGETHPDFADFLGMRPEATMYAAFRSAGERLGRNWREWPAAERPCEGVDPRSLDDAGRYHLFAQWRAERQLAHAAGGEASLYLDLPLGVHADGYDAWRCGELLAPGASAGAPPDPLFRGGQNWGFQPVRPDASRATGHEYWRAALRHHLRHARVLRLDHAMSLERLYWIPAGMPATKGVYVRYPTDELVACLTLEAARAGAVIVGEDLGTVSREMRRTLSRHGLQRMWVVQFEIAVDEDPPLRAQPRASLASLDTHDLPTFAAFWRGLDLDDQRALDLIDDAELEEARRGRREMRRTLGRWLGLPAGRGGPPAEAVLEPLLLRVAEGGARMLAVNLEDLWLEERPQNVPGTATERPNWRRRATHSLDDVIRSPDISRLLRAVARARKK